MSFVGDVMQGVGAIGEGQAQRTAAVARKEELGRAAELQTIAAKESSAARGMDLQRTLGGIAAIASARGLNPNSPSAMAIEAGARRVAETDIQRTGFNARQQASSLNLAGRAAAQAGEAAAMGGYLKGAGSFFKAASSAASTLATGGAG